MSETSQGEEANRQAEAGTEAAEIPTAPDAGTENHDAASVPQPDDRDHFLEVSAVSYDEAANSTRFMLVNYYLNADGSKTVKDGETAEFPGNLGVPELVAKVQSLMVEPEWNIKAVFSESTTKTDEQGA